MIGIGGLGGELDQVACSRALCHETATWRLDWRNPRIHAEDRVKTWLACDEHVDYLREFLAARDFPLTVAPLSTTGRPVAGTA
ncbi:hypothetical protein [Glaciibacter sp. 2TAF33]|uniref:hypothetical protein n=1 Tax=Glaciibacter sp. 2TAF33 TaxID=3233015 RepID=UPI003F910308